MKRRAGEARIIAKERKVFTCITCEGTLGVTWRCEEGADIEQWKRDVQEGTPFPVGLGWRKLEEGWKCGNCTGIPGQVGKAVSKFKGRIVRAVATFDESGKLTGVHAIKKGGRKRGK